MIIILSVIVLAPIFTILDILPPDDNYLIIGFIIASTFFIMSFGSLQMASPQTRITWFALFITLAVAIFIFTGYTIHSDKQILSELAELSNNITAYTNILDNHTNTFVEQKKLLLELQQSQHIIENYIFQLNNSITP